MQRNNEADLVRASLPVRDLFEALAEESAELSQAALKCIRAEGLNQNPTTTPVGDAWDNLLEELTDVYMVALAMGVMPDEATIKNSPKWKRWIKRINNAQ